MDGTARGALDDAAAPGRATATAVPGSGALARREGTGAVAGGAAASLASAALGAAAGRSDAGEGGAAGVSGLFRALGPGRIAALGAVALMLLGFFAFIAWRVSAPEYTLLFAGLQLADSERLTRRLDEMSVPYRLGAAGDAIMVPADKALRLRMSLAEEGMPLGTAVAGYELLDRAGPFGTSEFQAGVNLRRAIEGELARSIGTLRQVRSARVHINQPKREPFARDPAPATASIVLSLRGGAELDKRQVAGIEQLVAAAVPGLRPDRVTLVDDHGRLLGRGVGSAGEGLAVAEAEDYRTAFEERLRAKIVQLLERSVGPGRVDAVVSAEVDLDEVATTAETYDPNGQVVRSTQTTEEKSDAAERDPENAVTVANNLPTERNQASAAGATSSERSNRTEETVNYEISRVVRNQTRRGGVVKRLSIAVQVDGDHKPGPDGAQAYAPRSAEELKELAALVRGAAGLDEARGDHLEIVSRRFVQPGAGEPEEDGLLGLEREDYWRAGELATYALLTALVLLLGVRPALRHAFPPRERSPALPAPEGTAVVLGADGKPLLVHGATGATVGVDASGNPVLVREPIIQAGDEAHGQPPDGDPAQPTMLDLRHVRGRVRASLVEDVAGFIENHPEEAVRVIRGWLHGKQ